MEKKMNIFDWLVIIIGQNGGTQIISYFEQISH
jgi:hypothetical protein